MNFLITGATGYIGRALCKHLLEKNHHITALTRNPQRARSLFPDTSISFVSSLSDIDDDSNIDVIVNLSGEPILFKRWTPQRKKELEDSRIGVTQDIIELVRRLGKKPSTLISGSAVGYYGNRGDRKLTEVSHGNEDFGHRLCAAWEGTALRVKAYDVRVCIVRTGVVIGREGGFMQGMLTPFKMGVGAKIGSGSQWMSWIHLDDLIAVFMRLVEDANMNGIVNATAPLPVTNAYFSNLLGKVLRRPVLFRAPAWLLEMVLGENAEVLLGGQRVLPKVLEDAGFEFKYPNLESALRSVV